MAGTTGYWLHRRREAPSYQEQERLGGSVDGASSRTDEDCERKRQLKQFNKYTTDAKRLCVQRDDGALAFHDLEPHG